MWCYLLEGLGVYARMPLPLRTGLLLPPGDLLRE